MSDRSHPQRSDVGVLESYCGQCERWSPDDDWPRGEVEIVDEEPLETWIACPLCGHHFPPLDPPMRNRP